MSRGATRDTDPSDWHATLHTALSGAKTIDMVGVGNELRGDDGAGLRIASELRTRLRKSPQKALKVHPAQALPERLLSKLAETSERIIIFDAVEASARPGAIVCASLRETKYGFFATHNVPLRLVPGLAARADDVYIVGVQPKSMEVKEDLSKEVLGAVNGVVDAIMELEGKIA